MSSSDHQNPANRGIDRRAVVRTLLVQVLILLALAGAFIGYVNWSSERAFSEFLAASETVPQDSNYRLQSSASVQAVKGKAFCPRKD